MRKTTKDLFERFRKDEKKVRNDVNKSNVKMSDDLNGKSHSKNISIATNIPSMEQDRINVKLSKITTKEGLMKQLQK